MSIGKHDKNLFTLKSFHRFGINHKREEEKKQEKPRRKREKMMTEGGEKVLLHAFEMVECKRHSRKSHTISSNKLTQITATPSRHERGKKSGNVDAWQWTGMTVVWLTSAT